MTEQERQLAIAQHAIEQQTEMIRTIVVPAVASYYKALRAEGVAKADATMLTMGLQDCYLGMMFPDSAK